MIVYTGNRREYVGSTTRFKLAKYMGRWYDVAHRPFKFQAPCLVQSTAEYRLLPDGSVSVRNQCGDKVAKGIATGNNDMRLKVKFPEGPAGDYWIVAVDSRHYRWSVVSNADRSLLWILSRTATLPGKTLQKLIRLLRRRGYVLDDLEYASRREWHNPDIEIITLKNREFRQVMATGPHLQLVLMSLEPGTEIGAEVHPHTDQFFRIEDGRGLLQYKHREQDVWTETAIGKNAAILIPAGVWHNIRAVTRVALYTLYAPPKH